jgi:nucleoside-diphosphate-sugar epimerase
MAMPNTTALVTGACGFLGSHLVEKLVLAGSRVIGVDNFCTGHKANKAYLEAQPYSKHIKLIEADVSSPWTWVKELGAIQGLNRVFHFASPASPPHYQRLGLETMWVNTVGLKNALEFADSHKARVVFASTSEIYGEPLEHPQREDYRGNVNTVGPRSCYDESKRFGESLIYTHNKRHGTKHGIVRIFNTYGPRMNKADGRVVINFLVQATKGESLSIYGDGKQTRSFCFVDDLIEGILKFSQLQHLGPVNIGNDKEFTILELANEVKALFPTKKLQTTFHDFPTDDPHRRCPSIGLARELFSFAPKVPLKEGLLKMHYWLQEQS